MSKFSVGNHVRLTKLGNMFTDRVGVVVEVFRQKHWWAYDVQFGNVTMPVAEHHLVLAESVSSAHWLGNSDPAITQLYAHLDKLPETANEAAAAPAEPDPVNRRAEVLRTAESLVNGARADDYGPPEENFGRVAALWSAQFAAKLKEPLTADEIAIALVHLKLSRLANTPGHTDSWIDAAGYVALGAEIVDGAA